MSKITIALESESLKVLLEGIEDKILETGALTDAIPFEFIDVSLTPKAYDDDGEERVKITIDIGTEGDGDDVSEDECETIADAVRDILSDKGFFDALGELGIEEASEVVDWFPVSFDGKFPTFD